MATLKENLQTALNSFIENYTSENAVLALAKTFQSHNITIEDWNQMLVYLNKNTQFNEHVKEILPKMVEAIEDCVVTTSNIQNINPEDYKSGTIILDTSSKIMYIVQNNTASVFLNLAIIEEAATQNELQEAISNAITNIQENYISPINNHLESLDNSVENLGGRIENLEEFAMTDYRFNKHILKIGDPRTNEIEATFAIFTEILATFNYPKYAYAICIEPRNSETPEENLLPFRGDTLFICAKRGDVLGYEVHSSGKTYWFTANSVTEIFATKEDLATKQDELTFDSTPTANSSNPVTSGGVYASVEAVILVAEGRCKSYTISVINNPAFNTQNSFINGRDVLNIIDISGNTIQLSDLKNGDIILVVETDVPDRWFSNSDLKFYVLETAKVDLTDYYTKTESDEKFVDLNSVQTITGEKTFQSLTKFNSGVQYDNANKFIFKDIDGNELFRLTTLNFRPNSNGQKDIGASNFRFRDIYLSRNFTDGTNELSVADIKQGIDNSASKNLISDEYQNTELYAVGDLVIHNNTLYRCTTAVTTAENFDSTKWTATTIDAELINKVDTVSTQSISGIKTLLSALQFDNNNYQIFKDGNVLKIKVNNTDVLILGNSSSAINSVFRANSDNSKDLGQHNVRWKDLYLAGKIKNGTNEVTLAELIGGNLNVIAGADISSNILSDDQYAIFTNGKPTLITGTYQGINNAFYAPVYSIPGSGNYSGIGMFRNELFCYVLNPATKSLTLLSTSTKSLALRSIYSINGKEISFPTTNTKKQVLTIAPNGGALAWEDKGEVMNTTTDLDYVFEDEEEEEE